MTGKRVRLLVVVATPLAIIGLVIGVSWTPSPHPVRTPAAIAISNYQVVDDESIYVNVPPAPSMSLADLRCEVWKARASTCPDPLTLAKQLWPQVAQSLRTLYVGLPGCSTFFGYGFNVEYVGSSRTLILHCYHASAWYVAPGPPGVRGEPTMALILVGTDRISPGSLTVAEDNRVEHLIGDDSTQTVLGRVTVS